jgi:transposase
VKRGKAESSIREEEEIRGDRAMREYPSNISRAEFGLVQEALENAKKKTRPRSVDLYEVFCAVLYVLKSGCQWDMLPTDFPKKSTVYYYFQTWTRQREDGSTLLEEVLKKTGRPMAYRRWKERLDEFLYHRRPEREEHRHGGEKGL